MKSEKNCVLCNKKKQSTLLLFVIIFFVGNSGFYFKERAKWIYDGQPYPQAKEWLIPANMMLVYGTTLAKLPFVDERSFIMKPIIGLQDYFVKKWQENLPNDDAEKYLGWYVFRLRTYIVPNGGGIILYSNKNYSFDEVIEFNEKGWKTIEATLKYEAKDEEFNEIRYAAFNNLSALFVSNFTAYWIHNPVPYNPDYIDQSILENRYLTKNSYVDTNTMLSDTKQHARLFKLYEGIKQINTLYKERFPDIYNQSKIEESSAYWENSRLHELADGLIYYLLETEQYKDNPIFCEIEKNSILADYIQSKKWLLKHEDFLKTNKISIEKTVSNARDEQIQKACPNINLIEELNNGNSNN